MKLIWPLPFLGQDKREFATSVFIVVAGTLLGVLRPAFSSVESHTPLLVAFQNQAARLVGFLVVYLVAFFCALNAYNDKQQHPIRRRVILVWALLLLAWLMLQLRDIILLSRFNPLIFAPYPL